MTEKPHQRAPQALIVDDDPVLSALCGEALAAIGFAVREEETGEDALAAVEERIPDLVLLDVRLPGRDGFSTCEAMRANPALAEAPILIITGRADSLAIDRAFEVGATDFIKKPIDWQLLQHRVRFVMRANTAFKDLEDARLDLEESRHSLKAARQLGKIGIWELDREGGQMLWSEEMYQLVGMTPAACSSPGWDAFLSLVHPDDRYEVEKAVSKLLDDGRGCTLEHRLEGVDSAVRFVHEYIETFVAVTGELKVRGTIRDVTDRKRAEARISYLSSFDTLTQLPNRNYLNERLERLLGRSVRTRESVTVLCVDLDRFERVNRALGHAMGDDLLRAVAGRLLDSVRATDFVGRGAEPPDVSRFGGDEFTVVLSGGDSAAIGRRAAERIQRSLSEPFEILDHRIPLSASIGVAASPQDGMDGDTLISNAASAMTWAKKAGGGVFRFFDAATSESAMRQLTLEGDLAAALEREEFTVEYQPQCCPETGDLEAVEALVRWNHPRLGRVMPNDFIPVAEACGLISDLGSWVLRRACAQQSEWDAVGLPPFRMSVNVSSVQFNRGNLIAEVRSMLEDYRVDPGRFEIEITETALLGEGDDVFEICRGLREMGVSLALDDFGTGYSSLNHLFRFPIDRLKIDRSFVARIRPNDNACEIIAAVIAMAKCMGITVIAEGVEESAQEEFLREQGCHLLQGFGICRPAPPDVIEAWIRQALEKSR